MTQISHITSKDIHQVEKIGKICLPIYYQASDLLFLLFDNNYIMFKITNSINEIMGSGFAKKFHECQQYEDDDNDLNFFGKIQCQLFDFILCYRNFAKISYKLLVY